MSDETVMSGTAEAADSAADCLKLDLPALNLEIPYTDRTPQFYAARKEVLGRGAGTLHDRALQYFTVLKDDYDETLSVACMERDDFAAQCKDLQLKLDRSKTNNEVLWGKIATQDELLQNLFREPPQLPSGGTGAGIPKIFSVQVKELPTFRGEKNAEKVIMFLMGLERVFTRRARETGTSNTTEGWGDYAVGQLRDQAAQWGQCEWPTGKLVDWKLFKSRIRTQYIPASAVEDVESQLASLKVGVNQPLKDFNYNFLQLRLKLRIIEGKPDKDNNDNNVIKAYLTKIRTTSKDEPPSKSRIKSVWASWAQWRLSNPDKRDLVTLNDVMTYFQTMDDALHGDADDKSVVQETTPAAVDPDAMDLSKLEIDKLELFKLGVEYAKRGRNNQKDDKWGYRSRGNSGSKSSSGTGGGSSNGGCRDRSRSREDSDRDDDWKKSVKCWNCGILGHLRADCRKKKRLDLQITKIEESSDEEVEEADETEKHESKIKKE